MILSIPISTWICLAIIAGTFLVCLILVRKYKNDDQLIANRRLVEFFPTLVSTLGVLGTFYGITIGLLAFDTTDLNNSIPGLLDGLKTAFFTSLAGMVGSMILSAFITRKQDEKDGGISDANQAAVTICSAVQQMSDLNKDIMESLKQQLSESEADRKAFYRSMGDFMNAVKSSQNNMETYIGKIKDYQESLSSVMDSMLITNRSQDTTLCELKETNSAMIVSIGNLEEPEFRIKKH